MSMADDAVDDLDELPPYKRGLCPHGRDADRDGCLKCFRDFLRREGYREGFWND